MRRFTSGFLAAAFAILVPGLAHAEVDEIRITKQPGIIYLGPIVMEQQKLIEKEGAKLGLPDLKAKWITFGGGGAAIDALLSGNVDVVTTGASNMLLAWDRTKGQVKGLAGSSSTPMWLLSNEPDVKTLRDLKPTEQDRGADGQDQQPGHHPADCRPPIVRRRQFRPFRHDDHDAEPSGRPGPAHLG